MGTKGCIQKFVKMDLSFQSDFFNWKTKNNVNLCHYKIQCMELAEHNKVEKSQIAKGPIDIEELIRSKNKKLLRFIPGFFIQYMKRVIHQNELNSALIRNSELYGLDFVEKALEEFHANIVVNNIHNISSTDRILIASNHPLGGLDGLTLMHVAGGVRKDIVFPVNDLLMFLPNLKILFIPINKHGSNAENIAIVEETFASDKTILYFPAGLCSRKHKGIICDSEWKKTFISKAKQHKRDIVPVFVDGKNSNFFYRLSNIRRFFGIKLNMEMFYLVDEMYKQKNKNISITFGKPIPYQVFDKRHKDKEWAQLLKKYVYELGVNKDIVFNPDI